MDVRREGERKDTARLYGLTSPPPPLPPSPPRTVLVKSSRSEVDPFYRVFIVFSSTVFNNGGDATSTSSTQDIPRCTAQGPGSQQQEGEISDCLSYHSPKVMSLCNIDGMHALLLKQVFLFHVLSF